MLIDKTSRFNDRKTIVTDDSFLDYCNKRITSFYMLWKSKCKDGIIPARSDFDPLEMIPFLPSITMVDVDEETGDLSYRLVGTAEVEIRGSDPTGKPVEDYCIANNIGRALSNYGYVITSKSVLYDGLDIPSEIDGLMGDETIFLPLSKDGKNVDIIILYSVQKELVEA